MLVSMHGSHFQKWTKCISHLCICTWRKECEKITQGGNLTLAANQKFFILSAKLTWNDSLAAGGQVLVHKSWFRHFGTSVGPNHL